MDRDPRKEPRRGDVWFDGEGHRIVTGYSRYKGRVVSFSALSVWADEFPPMGFIGASGGIIAAELRDWTYVTGPESDAVRQRVVDLIREGE